MTVCVSAQSKTIPGEVYFSPSDNGYCCEDVDLSIPKNWTGTLGACLPANTVIRLRIAGRSGAPVVAVLGGISANRIVADHVTVEGDIQKGWWRHLAGADKAIDTDRFRIAAIDFVADDETPVDITTADQAALFSHALKQVGIDRVYAFVGASFGGMVALSFARQFPEQVERIALLCAAHRPSPAAQALRTVQRRILALGLAKGVPEESVAIARELAMTTYRTAEEFNTRFSCSQSADGGVAGYLAARGEDYKQRTSAARYLSLSGAIDRHFEVPEEITPPALIIGADSDLIAPLSDVSDLADRYGGPVQSHTISSVYGHDAFLKEATALSPLIKTFLLEI